MCNTQIEKNQKIIFVINLLLDITEKLYTYIHLKQIKQNY